MAPVSSARSGRPPMVADMNLTQMKIDLIDVLFRAERSGLVLPDNGIGLSSTVSDIVDLIAERLREREPPRQPRRQRSALLSLSQIRSARICDTIR